MVKTRTLSTYSEGTDVSKIPKRIVLVYALLSIVTILTGYFVYIEFHNRTLTTTSHVSQ